MLLMHPLLLRSREGGGVEQRVGGRLKTREGVVGRSVEQERGWGGVGGS